MAFRLLNQYPWFPGTSIGFHLGYGERHRDAELVEMKVNVVLDINQDVDRAKWFHDRKINVVFRPHGACEAGGSFRVNTFELEAFCRKVKDNNLPLYIQLGNEIAADDQMLEQWILGAEIVTKHGGFPGVQVLPKDQTWAFLDRLRSRGKLHLMDNGWVNTHDYPFNHPWNFPYDAINQQEHPGRDFSHIESSYSTFGFLYTNKLVSDFFGGRQDIIPIIVGEGGATVDPEMYRDRRYDTLSHGWWTNMNHPNHYPHPELVGEAQQKARVWQFETFKKVVDFFRNGKLEFTPGKVYTLPDRMFGYCFWITEDTREENHNMWAGEGFWSRVPTRGYPEAVAYLKNMPVFTRGRGVVSKVPPYQFTLGFADFAKAIPGEIGEPLNNETAWVVDGEYVGQVQRTTKGILQWIKELNYMSFLARDGHIYAYNGGNIVKA